MACCSGNVNTVSATSDATQNLKLVSDDDVDDMEFYKMTHPKRGTAIIFNHNYFIEKESRCGTKVDRNKLKKALKYLGFDVKVYNDLSYRCIMKVVKEEAQADHSKSDCFVMAVLSHGERDLLFANDGRYQAQDLWTSFTDDECPSLSQKPKLFFVQACRGDKCDPGVTLKEENGKEEKREKRGNVGEEISLPRTYINSEDDSLNFKIFSHPDILIAFATVPGYFSWRNPENGSWFIQALCSELKNNGRKLNLHSLLTVVSRRVAINYESCCPDNISRHNMKQIPCIISTLTKLVMFPKKSCELCIIT